MQKDHFKYYHGLEMLIDNEIIIYKYKPEYKNDINLKKISEKWYSDRSIENFNNYLKYKTIHLRPRFFLEDEHMYFMLVFLSTSDLILELEKYYSIFKKEQEKDLDSNVYSDSIGWHNDYDYLIDQTIWRTGLQLIMQFQKRLRRYYYFDFLKPWVDELWKLFSNFKVTSSDNPRYINSLIKINSHLSKLYKIISTNLIDPKSTEEQIDSWAILLSWIIYFQEGFYNLLIARDKMIEIDEEQKNIKRKIIKPFLDNYENKLEFLKIDANLHEN